MYIGIIILLMILQINQQHQLNKVKKELKQVWEQLAMMLFTSNNKKEKE